MPHTKFQSIWPPGGLAHWGLRPGGHGVCALYHAVPLEPPNWNLIIQITIAENKNNIFEVLFIHINKFLFTWALSTDLIVLMLGPGQPHLLYQLFKNAKSAVYQLLTGYPDTPYQVSAQLARLGLSPMSAQSAVIISSNLFIAFVGVLSVFVFRVKTAWKLMQTPTKR